MNHLSGADPATIPDRVDAGAFGALLLTLYQSARELAVDPFQDLVVKLLARHIRFDGSWWATTARLDGRDRVYGSHLSGVPADLPGFANRTQGADAIRDRISAWPNTTFIFDAVELRSTPGSASIAAHAGISQMMSTSSFSPVTNLLSFFSLARHEATPAFTERERQMLDLLMPHLTAMLHMSRVAQLSHLRGHDSAPRSTMGAADGFGMLHATEPGFPEMLRSEWPAWSGPCLPHEVSRAIELRKTRVQGRTLNVDLSWVQKQVLVTLSRRSALEALTPQEQTVSTAFAAGRSYKEVARDLRLAPATVRHYLRSAYAKIGVSDKAALAQAIARH